MRDDELDLLDPTHRGLHRFIPRHKDELEIDIGDPIYVQKEADDLWCEGEYIIFLHSIIPSIHKLYRKVELHDLAIIILVCVSTL